MTRVKICGIKDPENLNAAIHAGARYIGFVFYEASPRFVSFDTAWNLARMVPTGIRSVGLFVDPDDEYLHRIVSGIQLDMIQLHGNETPERVAKIKQKFKMPVMKAIRVAGQNDLDDLEKYEAAADWLLFDAKIDGDLPGGTGHSFDWSILAGREFSKPWMLGGGLNADNIGEALSILRPDAVDVSSGVESSRGQKDPVKIKAFISRTTAATKRFT